MSRSERKDEGEENLSLEWTEAIKGDSVIRSLNVGAGESSAGRPYSTLLLHLLDTLWALA